MTIVIKETSISVYFSFEYFEARVLKVMVHVGAALVEEPCLALAQGKLSLFCLKYWC